MLAFIPEAADDLGQIVVELACAVEIAQDFFEFEEGHVQSLQSLLATLIGALACAGSDEGCIGFFELRQQMLLVFALVVDHDPIFFISLKSLFEQVFELCCLNLLQREFSFKSGRFGKKHRICECQQWIS